MCLDCDFERENVDLKSVSVISVIVIVTVFGFVFVFVFGSKFLFFLVGPRIGPNPLTGPGKKTRLVNGQGSDIEKLDPNPTSCHS